MQAFTAEQAKAFCGEWLPAWTGNDPERLAAFYTQDVFYSDPAIRDGVRGRQAFTAYLTDLLRKNPDWVWRHEVGVPLLDGFLNKWCATVPVGNTTVVYRGVCSVQLRDGLIYRNEVYCDLSALRAALDRWNRCKARA